METLPLFSRNIQIPVEQKRGDAAYRDIHDENDPPGSQINDDATYETAKCGAETPYGRYSAEIFASFDWVGGVRQNDAHHCETSQHN